jgi:hypothetical protein
VSARVSVPVSAREVCVSVSVCVCAVYRVSCGASVVCPCACVVRWLCGGCAAACVFVSHECYGFGTPGRRS